MALDRVTLFAMFIVSMIPYFYIAVRENGSSRGWLSRLFVGQDFLLIGTSIILGSAFGDSVEGTIQMVFFGSFVFKLIKGVELIVRRVEFARADPLYKKELATAIKAGGQEE